MDHSFLDRILILWPEQFVYRLCFQTQRCFCIVILASWRLQRHFLVLHKTKYLVCTDLTGVAFLCVVLHNPRSAQNMLSYFDSVDSNVLYTTWKMRHEQKACLQHHDFYQWILSMAWPRLLILTVWGCHQDWLIEMQFGCCHLGLLGVLLEDGRSTRLLGEKC